LRFQICSLAAFRRRILIPAISICTRSTGGAMLGMRIYSASERRCRLAMPARSPKIASRRCEGRWADDVDQGPSLCGQARQGLLEADKDDASTRLLFGPMRR